MRERMLSARGSRSPAGCRWVTWLLVVVLLGAVTAAGIFGQGWYDERQLNTARHLALATAGRVAVGLVSISETTVDQDLRRIAGAATGGFREEFTRGMATLRATVVANQVAARGTLRRIGVVSADRHSAVVLVAVDAFVRNVQAPAGRLSRYRIWLRLVRDASSGWWLVGQLRFI